MIERHPFFFSFSPRGSICPFASAQRNQPRTATHAHHKTRSITTLGSEENGRYTRISDGLFGWPIRIITIVPRATSRLIDRICPCVTSDFSVVSILNQNPFLSTCPSMSEIFIPVALPSARMKQSLNGVQSHIDCKNFS